MMKKNLLAVAIGASLAMSVSAEGLEDLTVVVQNFESLGAVIPQTVNFIETIHTSSLENAGLQNPQSFRKGQAYFSKVSYRSSDRENVKMSALIPMKGKDQGNAIGKHFIDDINLESETSTLVFGYETSRKKSRWGLGFAIGMGNAEGNYQNSAGLMSIENDSQFIGGFSYFGHDWFFHNFSISALAGYVRHDMDGKCKITSLNEKHDVNGYDNSMTVFSVAAQEEIRLWTNGVLSVIPHVGIRYDYFKTDADPIVTYKFNPKINNYILDKQYYAEEQTLGLFTIPVGVKNVIALNGDSSSFLIEADVSANIHFGDTAYNGNRYWDQKVEGVGTIRSFTVSETEFTDDVEGLATLKMTYEGQRMKFGVLASARYSETIKEDYSVAIHGKFNF